MEKTELDVLIEENLRLNQVISSMAKRLNKGRHYLLETPQKNITAIKALEAFGFNTGGFESE